MSAIPDVAAGIAADADPAPLAAPSVPSAPPAGASIRFPNLDALRLIAALSVMISHLYLIGVQRPFFLPSGLHGVSLFFLLSGFLITWTLMREQAKTGTMRVRRFYVRRVLRTFPLYYLVVIAVFLSPVRPPLDVLPFVLFFLTALLQRPPEYRPGAVGHTWSMGVEEIFYLTWPLLIRRFGVAKVCLTIIVVQRLLILVGDHLARAGEPTMSQVLWNFKFDFLAIGGLLAWAVMYHRARVTRVLCSPLVAWGSLALALLMYYRVILIGHVPIPLFEPVIFGVAMLNFAMNPAFPRLEHPAMIWLGKRTYGIFLWHYPILIAVNAYLPSLEVGWKLALGLSSTLALACLTYAVVEKPFLRLSERLRAGKAAPDMAVQVAREIVASGAVGR